MKTLLLFLFIFMGVFMSATDAAEVRKAMFAGGCFWCMQPPYDKLPGVISTTVGYSGGNLPQPTYEQVSSGTTGHYEVLQVVFDPQKTSYPELLRVFWRSIDPTDNGGQFADQGPQYRPAIFVYDDDQRREAENSIKELTASRRFKKPIVTAILPAKEFYPAEGYHQKYYQKNSLHYNAYKTGSGRAGFLHQTWPEANP
ncbi:MAG: peptide-methionine (S)-S-oxide reductase MsrA [Candidatus Omnitrophica bacterium]|nr:peptide-methionine (S)-S-oxide reductase MsrA [Candidatus Omnitrophota bacterium]